MFKEKLNIDEIIILVEELGGECKVRNKDHLIFTSIDFRVDADSHSPKLYYYHKSCNFYNFACGESYDIYSLVESRWNLLDIEFYFKDVLNFILTTLGYSSKSFETKKTTTWRTDLSKFFTPNSMVKSLKIYPKSDLKRFVDKFPLEWIIEGISVPTMQKYNIGYYPLQDCTTIPVFDKNGELVGIHGRYWQPESVEMGRKYLPIYTLNKNYKFPTGNTLYGLYQNQDNIKKTKEVKIFEAPKSVLMCEDILEINNSVAIFGWNLSNAQKNMLIELEVDRFIICLDKWGSQEQDIDIWQKQVNKMCKTLSLYGEVKVIEDNNGLLDYKDSPVDKGKEIWEELYND